MNNKGYLDTTYEINCKENNFDTVTDLYLYCVTISKAL